MKKVSLVSGLLVSLLTASTAAYSKTEIVGSDGGSISVGNSGQASWTMPINVPSGINGISPKLEVSVSSSGGNGYLGVGGGLSGLSAITRCAKTVFYDGYTQSPQFEKGDAYCLNGQRLRLQTGTYGQAGSVYRTAVESFQLVKAHGSVGNTGPEYFEVINRAGASMLFGNNANAFDVDPETGAVTAWKIDTLRDSNSNTLRYEYSDISGQGEIQLSRISYGANEAKGLQANLFVEISYEDRPDKTILWNRGVRYEQSKRISAIRTRVGNEPVEEYLFTYEQGEVSGLSRLATAQECAANECYRQSGFNYQAETQNNWQSSSLSVPGDLQTTDGKPLGLLTDINNDGLIDWVNAYRDEAGQDQISTYLGSNNGFESSSSFSLPNVLFDYQIMAEGFAKGSLLDLNADGFPDYVQAYQTDNQTILKTWRNTGQGFQLDADLSLPVALVSSAFGTQSVARGELLDINGDNLVDIVEAYRLPNGETHSQTWIHTVNSGQHNWVLKGAYEAPSIATDYTIGTEGRVYASIQDVNSDGLPDWVAAYQENGVFQSDTWLNTGQGWTSDADYKLPKPLFNYDLAAKGVSEYTFNDINGDGYLDLIKAIAIDNGQQFDTWINTGISWNQDTDYNLPAPMTMVNDLGNSASIGGIADLDGDGFPDFFQNYQTTGQQGTTKNQWVYNNGWQSTSSFALPLTNSYIQADGNSVSDAQLADLNGDGFPEIFSAMAGSSSTVLTTNTIAQDQVTAYPGSLISTINPMGGITELFYGYSTDSSLYEPSSISAYPNVAYNSPVRLVSMIAASTGRKVNGEQEMTYAIHSYAKGKTNLQGMGGLGYAQHNMKDNNSGLEIITSLHQTYPYMGQIEGSIKSIDGQLISTSLSSTEIKDITINGLTTIYPHPNSSIAEYYSFNKALTATTLAKKTETTAEVDQYGNTLSSTELTYDGQNALRQESTTITEYRNDIATDKWILGMPKKTTSILKDSITGDEFTNISIASFEDDGKVKSEIAEPGNAQAVTKQYDYDDFGNRITSTTTAAGVEPRTTTIVFTESGRFPKVITNTLNHETTSTYDEIIGKPTMVTDANNITKEYVYNGFGTVVKETKAHQSNGAMRGRQIVLPRWCDSAESIVANCPDNAVYFIAAFDDEGEAPEIAFYDVNGKELRKQTYGHEGQIIAVETVYNENSQVIQVSRPYFLEQISSEADKKWTYYEYDKLGRETQHTNIAGKVFKTYYDGLSVEKENPANGSGSGVQKTKITNDIFGRTIESIDPDGNSTQYNYDARGLLLETIDAHQNVATITYDEVFGRKESMDDPDLGKWSYQYDALGQLIQQKDAENQITEIQYDVLGRMKLRIDAKGTAKQTTTTWVFDGEGAGQVKGGLQLVETKTSNGDVLYSRAMTYDDFGRAIKSDSSINPNGALDATRNYVQRTGYLGTADKVDWIEYPSSLTVRSTYDDYGFPKTVEGIDLNYAGYEAFQEASNELNEAQRDFELWKNANLDQDQLTELEDLEAQIRLQGEALSGFYDRFEDDSRKTALDDDVEHYSGLLENVETKIQQHQNWLKHYSAQLTALTDQIKPDLDRIEELRIEVDGRRPTLSQWERLRDQYLEAITNEERDNTDRISNSWHLLSGVLRDDIARIYFDDVRDNLGQGVFSEHMFDEGALHYIIKEYLLPGKNADHIGAVIEAVFNHIDARYQNHIDIQNHANYIEHTINPKIESFNTIYTEINEISDRIQPQLDRITLLSPIVASHSNILLSFTDRLRLYTNEIAKISGTYVNREQLGHDTYLKAFQDNINYVRCLRDQTNKTTGQCYAENLVFDDDPAEQTQLRADVDKYTQVDVRDFWRKNRFFCSHYYGYACYAAYRDDIIALARTLHVYQCQNQARHVDPARQLLTDAQKNAELSCNSNDWVASKYAETSYPYLYTAQIGNFDHFMNSLRSRHQSTVETAVCAAGKDTYAEECNPFADIVAGNVWQANPEQAAEETDNGAANANEFVLIRKGSMQNLIASAMTATEREANAELKIAQIAVQELLGDTAYTDYYVDILNRISDVQDLYNEIDTAYANAANDEAYEESKKIYWQAEEINAAGQILSAKYGNGTQSSWGYDDFGRINLGTVRGTDNTILIENSYVFDDIGNLMSRHDKIVDFKEDFSYDTMNRLIESDVSGTAAIEMESFGIDRTLYSYDEIGNMLSKSDFSEGSYRYGDSNSRPSNAGPHAVLSIDFKGSFTYDKNGNQLTGNNRTTTYSAFNKPTQIIKAGVTTDMRYGAERQLIWQQDNAKDNEFTQTFYVGGLYEEEFVSDSDIKQRHSIAVAGQVIAIVEKQANSDVVTKESYLHKNHQGSVIAISDQQGDIVERRHYDAFGKLRRNVVDIIDFSAPLGDNYITDRGFTGHKHFTSAGIIHMGGRVFDPEVGRFMSADPHIQAPLNSQSLNRYSYTLNNPLSFTDPSGYFFSSIFKKLKKLFDKIKKIIKKVVETIKKIAKKIGNVVKKIGSYVKKYARVIVAVVVAVAIVAATGGAGGFFAAQLGSTLAGNVAAGALAGAASGLITTGSLKGALEGAFFGAVTAGFAQWVGGANQAIGKIGKSIGLGIKTANTLVKVAAHGVIGGLRSVVNGGKFLAGFVSGAVGKAFTLGSNFLSDVSGGNLVLKGLIVATAGGLAATLVGGEFAAGFIAAGVGFAANQVATTVRDRAIVKRHDALRERVRSDVDLNPDDLIALSEKDIYIIIAYEKFQAREYGQSYYHDSFKVGDSDSLESVDTALNDTFIRGDGYSNSTFQINLNAGTLTALGADINYIGIGVSARFHGLSSGLMKDTIIFYNGYQLKDNFSHNFRQMFTGSRWAEVGYFN